MSEAPETFYEDPLLNSDFAPAERLPLTIVKDQYEGLIGSLFTFEILDMLPLFILILNKQRQIIYSNRYFRETFGNTTLDILLGKRPGEAMGCSHSDDKSGCGTTEYCRNCGAVNAILESQREGFSVKEAILNLNENASLNVLIWATQKKIFNDEYTVVAMNDISNEKKKMLLEKIFFHDLLNMAGSLKGYLDIIKDTNDDNIEMYLERASNISNRIIDEIRSQRTLVSAESGMLEVFVTPFTTRELIEDVKILLCGQDVAPGKTVEISNTFYDGIIESDKALLKRVILNLGKNALEAIKSGEKIVLDCVHIKNDSEEFIEFTVHNPSFIPSEIQFQLFQRSFSTKGNDRGIGTYSVKLLTENYLGGSVRFTSDAENGTTFFVRYPAELKR